MGRCRTRLVGRSPAGGPACPWDPAGGARAAGWAASCTAWRAAADIGKPPSQRAEGRGAGAAAAAQPAPQAATGREAAGKRRRAAESSLAIARGPLRTALWA
uniref:Uncharacterized protein n=1 Tax=Alexandrium monilatum TaxID=311494 RepID=A0A7S4T8N5_9DINO